MTALEKVAAEVASARDSARAALAFVNSIASPDDASEAYDRVRLVKEWAKIRKIAREVHDDLLRLECHCLRKLAQLDALSIVPRGQRTTAEFYRDLSDSQINDLIREFGEKATPNSLRQRATAKGEFDKGRRYAIDGEHLRCRTTYAKQEVADAAERHLRDTQGALAAILEDYIEGDEGFSVYELTQQLIESVDLDERSARDWGVRAGLTEVCRKAVRDAPDVMINGSVAPRFITCLDRSLSYAGQRDHWIRVPFHAATLDQLADMVELRSKQAADAEAASRAASALYGRLAGSARGDDSLTLGELAARLALGDLDGAA